MIFWRMREVCCGGCQYVLYPTFYDVRVEWSDEILGQTYEQELVSDILSLMASFSAKIYGKRSSQNRKNKAKEV